LPLRNDDDHRSKDEGERKKLKEKSGLNEIRTHDHAIPVQHSNWELVHLCVRIKSVDGEQMNAQVNIHNSLPLFLLLIPH